MPLGLRRRLPASAGQAPDRGFTLIELLTVMAIMSILSGMAIWGFASYTRAQNLSQTASGLLSELRAAAQQATAEDRTYCISIDSATTYSLWRYSCNPSEPTTPFPPVKINSWKVDGNSVLQNVSFTNSNTSLAHTCASGSLGCVFFYPRGNASDGTIKVSRSGSSAAKTITVVGLTGRVFQS